MFSKKLKGLVRVQVYLFIMGAILVGATVARAYHQGDSLVRKLGEQFIDATTNVGQAHIATVNGERFVFMVTVVDAKVEDILDEAEAFCASQSGDLADVIGPTVDALRDEGFETEMAPVESWTTMRRDDEGGGRSGDVACFVRPDDAPGGEGPGLVARLEEFAETMELGAFGVAHYFRADSTLDGKGTRILSVSSKGKLNVFSMFPEEGDAPGVDPEGVPRPPGSRRIFSSVINLQGDGTYMYSTSLPPEQVIELYEKRLPEAGWLDVGFETDDERIPHSAAFSQDQRATYVLANPTQDGRTDVTLIVLASRARRAALPEQAVAP